MPFFEKQGIRCFSFASFPIEQVTHAILTRRGGVSPIPWDSLNVGGTVGDDRSRVIENRMRSFQALGRDPHSMFDVWQVHSADVVIANAPHDIRPPEIRADAIITDNPEVTLFMRFADCTPILLFDPVKSAIGLVHAGWLGTVRQVTSEAVRAMTAAYGSRPGDILAGIGPAIGPDHYEIGPDVIARVRETFQSKADGLLVEKGDRVHFDLWQANKVLLNQSGVEQVELSNICTACHPENWFSHRGQYGKTGRFGALIALK
jgi:YfiH family protein